LATGCRLHRLASQYDNSMLELTVSPSQGLRILPQIGIDKKSSSAKPK